LSSSVTGKQEFLGLLERGGDTPYLVISDEGRPRWAFPTSPTSVLRASMAVYTPGTARAVAAWYGAGAIAAVGLGTLLPGRRRSVHLPLTDALSRIAGIGEAHLAVASSFQGDRCVVAIIDSTGRPRAFAKIAPIEDAGAAERLQTEARTLERVSAAVTHVRVPSVLHLGTLGRHLALVVTVVPGRPGFHPSRLSWRRADAAAEIFSVRGPSTTIDEHLALDVTDPAWRRRLAEVRAATRAVADVPLATGIVHGDFAAWNLLEYRGRVGIVDWEQARFDGLPFWDLWHFVVQAAGLARSSGSLRAVREAIRGRGPLVQTLDRYAEMCEVPSGIATDILLVYLLRTALGLIDAAELGAGDARRGLAFRTRLLDEALEIAR
jgi:hypothetical protein